MSFLAWLSCSAVALYPLPMVFLSHIEGTLIGLEANALQTLQNLQVSEVDV